MYILIHLIMLMDLTTVAKKKKKVRRAKGKTKTAVFDPWFHLRSRLWLRYRIRLDMKDHTKAITQINNGESEYISLREDGNETHVVLWGSDNRRVKVGYIPTQNRLCTVLNNVPTQSLDGRA